MEEYILLYKVGGILANGTILIPLTTYIFSVVVVGPSIQPVTTSPQYIRWVVPYLYLLHTMSAFTL